MWSTSRAECLPVPQQQQQQGANEVNKRRKLGNAEKLIVRITSEIYRATINMQSNRALIFSRIGPGKGMINANSSGVTSDSLNVTHIAFPPQRGRLTGPECSSAHSPKTPHYR